MTDQSVQNECRIETKNMRIATDYRPEILRQAARLFARKRFDEVLMDDVAAKVGVAKGTLYRFYATKEELYAAICFDWMDELIREIRPHLDSEDVGAEARLEAILVHVIEHFRKNQDFFQVLQRQEAQQALKQKAELHARRASFREVYAKAIRQGQAEGVVRPLNPAHAADLLMGMIRSVLVFGDPAQSPKATARGILDIFFNGVSQTGNPKGARK
ncbi:MAG: TetR/AcrR family transcriptional regulator [Planctomycetes bacterium]|nr:TetR/AcrR family transcriptional regulator [Planctomycetota bacterium]